MRPMIILKKFNKEIFWGIPLTKNHKDSLYYYPFKLKEKTSSAIISQIKLAVDAKRLCYKVGVIELGDLKEIKNRLIKLLE
jgi:mRNA interferase MazF